MPRSQAIADSLTKLLDESNRPIYAVDAQRRIVYCNAALAAWIDLESKRIVGRHVEFHSEEPRPDETNRGDTAPLTDLCPPPQVLAGESACGTISCLARDGRMLHRAAEFHPLGRAAKSQKARDQLPAQTFAALVLLASVDLSPQEVVSEVSGTPTADELHRIIRRFRRGQAQRYSIQSLLGSSSAMQKVRAQVEAAAASGANTLIYGCRGTGRSHVALAIHYLGSADRETRLIPLDCELVTEDLLAHSLEKRRPSQTNVNSQPTLLLENLENMPTVLQSLLLTALRKNTANGRIIATMDPQLHPESAERENTQVETSTEATGPPDDAPSVPATVDRDLIDCISTITIRIPRLVDRLEDLPILAQFFLEACNRNNSKQVGSLRSEALDSLALYSWPGELDQLRETIEAAHANCSSHEIMAADLPPTFHHAFRAATRVRRRPERIVLDELLASIEKEVIIRALAQSGGNKSEAASLLGMTRPRLYRRLVQLGLAGQEPDDVDQPESPEFVEHDPSE